MNFFIRIKDLMLRELRILSKNHMYGFCMVVFPLLTMVFFTTFLDEGLPEDMPIALCARSTPSRTRRLWPAILR